MIQNDKQLLLVDLCGRLPYGVKCRESGGSVRKLHPEDICRVGECMPYLRPMSAMSEEEKSEFCREFECAGVDVGGFGYMEGGTLEEYLSGLSFKMVAAVIGWLNAHHFDYRGLIESGLALEAPEGMYK